MPSLGRADDWDEDAGDDERIDDDDEMTSGEVPLMLMSGQSEDDRRELRQKQRELRAKILGISVSAVEEVKEARDQNNILWERVRFNREAVLDSDNVEPLTNKVALQTEKMITVRTAFVAKILASTFIALE